jgi:hypothetical protein
MLPALVLDARIFASNARVQPNMRGGAQLHTTIKNQNEKIKKAMPNSKLDLLVSKISHTQGQHFSKSLCSIFNNQ